MNTIDSFVHQATARFTKGTSLDYEFDPAIIIMIAEVVMELVMMLQENCKKEPEEAMALCKKPTRLQRRVVKWTAIKIMGWRSFRQDGGDDVVAAILSAGEEVSVEDLTRAYQEV